MLEPNWHTMMERLNSVATIDEVIAHHDEFLDSCMKECMLHNPQLLKILTKLMSTCIIFANHTERFTKSTAHSSPLVVNLLSLSGCGFVVAQR